MFKITASMEEEVAKELAELKEHELTEYIHEVYTPMQTEPVIPDDKLSLYIQYDQAIAKKDPHTAEELLKLLDIKEDLIVGEMCVIEYIKRKDKSGHSCPYCKQHKKEHESKNPKVQVSDGELPDYLTIELNDTIDQFDPTPSGSWVDHLHADLVVRINERNII